MTSELLYRSCGTGIMLVIGATGRRNVYRFNTKRNTHTHIYICIYVRQFTAWGDFRCMKGIMSG